MPQPVAMHNMLIDGIVDALTVDLVTNIVDGDLTKANVVRAGRLQADPTRGTGINVLVWPDEDSNPNELYTNDKQAGILAPTYEIGGGAFFMQRFRLNLLFHFKGYRGEDGRVDARNLAYVILARIRKTLHTMNMPLHPDTLQPKDDFGEIAIELQVDEFWMREGGGSGNYIWTGEIAFGFLTQTPTRYD